MENSQNKTPNKYVVLTTYLIAVVCLLLGLFLPLWGDKGILALQLPDAINKLANKDLISVKNEFALSYPVSMPGTTAVLDVTALVALLYALVTALSLLALIPVGVSTKRGTRTASVFAYIVEIAAVAITSVYVMIALEGQCAPDSLWNAGYELEIFSYNMVIALGGSLLMLIVLSLMNKKGTGVAKLFLFLLSAIGLLALYDFSLIIPKLADIKLSAALYGADYASASGYDHLRLLFEGGFADYIDLLPDAKSKAAFVLAALVALVAAANYFIDVIALSTNAKKSGYFFNIVRYTLEIVLIICLLITVAICKYTVGLMLIVLSAVALIQLLISAVRLLLLIRAGNKNDIEIDYDEPVRPYRRPEPIDVEPVNAPVNNKNYEQIPEPVYMETENRRPANDKYGFNEPAENEPVQMEISDIPPEPVYMEPAQQKAAENTVQPVPVQPASPVQSNTNAQEPQTRIYTINTIYGGPVDEFMRKLTNDERIEFAMTFIEKSKGNIGNIPEYVIGGNNRLFFSSVFIYLGRIRGLISDGLLNKMYKELNML